MKRPVPFIRQILIVFCQLSIVSGTAQTLVKDGKQWNIISAGVFTPEITSYSLLISGDTLLEDQVYKKVWTSRDSINQHWSLTNIFVREDQMHRVWEYRAGQQDQIQYDFNLFPGDSIIYDGTCTGYVTVIDSVILRVCLKI